MFKSRYVLFALGAVLAVLTACQRTPIQKAVRGSLLPSEENIVVTNHCQSCHLHAKFRAAPHMEKVRQQYQAGSEFRTANRCLQCHDLRLENIFRKETRRTLRPHGKLVNLKNIPRPKAPAPLKRKGEAAAKKPKKKRKWYFFYLF